MTTYSATGPDGKTYSLEGPAGATDDQVMAELQKQFAAQQPAAKPSMIESLGAGIGGGLAKMGLGAAAAAADYTGNKDTAASLDAKRQAVTDWQQQHGGGSLSGTVGDIVGASAPAMGIGAAGTALAPVTGGLSIIAAEAVNAGLFGIPAFRDTYNEQKKNGASEATAISQAAWQAGLATVGAKVVSSGGKLLPGVAKAGEGLLAKAGIAGAEGAALPVVGQVGTKAINAATGQQDNSNWLPSGKDVAASALGFGALGGAHHLMEAPGLARRKAEADQAAADQAAVAQKQQADQEATDAAAKQTPEYLQALNTKYHDFLAADQAAKEAVGPKPDAGVDPSAAIAWQNKYDAANSLREQPENADLIREHAERRDDIDAMNKAAEPAPVQAPAETPAAPAEGTDLFGEKVQSQETPAAIPTADDIESQRADLTRQTQGLESLLEQRRDEAAKAPDIDSTDAAIRRFDQTQAALKEAQQALAKLPAAPKPAPAGDALNKQMDTAQKALATAKENGDTDAMKRSIAKVRKLQQENPGLFTKAHEGAIQADEATLGQEMGAGREQAAAQTAKVGSEVEGIRRIATPQEPSVLPQMRQERGTKVEIADMEKGSMNTGVTDQPSLFPEAGGNAGVKESKLVTQAQRQELVLQLQEALRQRKNDPQKYRPVVDRLLERIRGLGEKGFNMPQARGSETAEIAPILSGDQRLAGEIPSASVAADTRVYAKPAVPMDVRREIAQLPKDLPPATNTLVQRVVDNFRGLANTKGGMDDTAAFVHRVRTGADSTELAQRVTEHLDRLEGGKRSETQIPTRETAWGTATKPTETAVQTDMFPSTEHQGTIFNDYPSFEKYLASDAVAAVRSEMKLSVDTAARAQARVAPMEAQAAELRETVANLQRILAHAKSLGDTAREGAITKLEAAVENAKALRASLDAKLEPARMDVVKAHVALAKASEAVAKVSDTIAKNNAKFNRDADVQAAAVKLADAQKAHADMLAAVGRTGKGNYDEAQKRYTAVVGAINEYRTLLEAHAKDTSKLPERSVLAYLQRDMELMLRMRDATQTLEKAATARESAADALTALDKEINGTPEAIRTMRAALTKVSNAKGVLTKATNKAEENRSRLSAEIIDKDTQRQQLERDIESALKPVQEARDARTTKQDEVQTQRERRDGAKRAAEQARAERLAAIPGVRVSHEEYRAALDKLEQSPGRIAELTAKAADETKNDTTRNKAKHDLKMLREQAMIAHGVLSREPENVERARAALDKRTEELSAAYEAKRTAINEVGITKSTQDSRKQEARELGRELRMMQKFSASLSGRAKTEVAGRVEGPIKEDLLQPEPTARLPLRKIGPVVRPVVGLGRVQQAGARKGVTGTQAMRGAAKDVAHEQAMLKLSKIEDLIERNDAALDAAKEAGNDALIEKHEGYATRLETGRMAAEKELAKAGVRPEDVANKPGAERESTPVSPEALDAAHDGRTMDVAADLAKNGSTPEVRDAAAKLQPLLIRTKFAVDENVTHKGEAVAGIYSPEQNKITMHPDGLTEQDIVHEMTHAATDTVLLADPTTLTPTQRAGRTGLENMWKGIEHNPNFIGEHGATSVREFAAEVYSNAQFRAKLDAMGKPLTLLDRFKNFVRQMLGMPTTPSGKAKDFVEQVMSASRAFKASEVPSIFRKAPEYTSEAAKFGREIAPHISKLEQIKENKSALPLAMEQKVVDFRAALRRVTDLGNKLLGTQVKYTVLQADKGLNNMHAVAEGGAFQLTKDSKGITMVKTGGGASAKAVLEAINKLPGANAAEKLDMAQGYLTALRARDVGYDRLDFSDPVGMQKRGEAVIREVESNPAMLAAMKGVQAQYRSLNQGLVKFLEQTNALPKDVTDKMLADKNYIPFYRANGDLILPDGKAVSVGDVRSMPFLKALERGDSKLMPFEDSMFRNIATLTNMGMQNMAARHVAYHLQDLGKNAGTMQVRRGDGPAVNDGRVIRFRQAPEAGEKGEDAGKRYVVIDTKGTAAEHIPNDLLAQAVAGTYGSTPSLLKVGAWASDILRSGVTRMPTYMVSQLIKDPMNASMLGNLKADPFSATAKTVGNFMEHLTKGSAEDATLSAHGVLHSNIFSGGASDVRKVAMQIAGDNQSVYRRVLAGLDKVAMSADAATRIQGYRDVVAAGGSEAEAVIHAVEMQNFNKRGASTSLQMVSRLVPFFNAQIQGLNVIAKSAMGKMPSNELLDTKTKFFHRALGMTAMAMAYCASMEDDKDWNKLTLHTQMANIPIPGLTIGGQQVHIPAPFESGMLFWSLPVAFMHALKQNFNENDWTAVKDIIMNQVPGNGSIVPQVAKGYLDVSRNYNSAFGTPIETTGMEKKDVTERFNASTPEAMKAFSRQLADAGVKLSPVQLDYLANAYLGQLPHMVGALTNHVFETKSNVKDAGEDATGTARDNPLLSRFVPNPTESRNVNDAYTRAKQADLTDATVKSMVKDGRGTEAKAYQKEQLAKYGSPQQAKAFENQMGFFKRREETIRSNKALSGDAKQAKLEDLYARKDAAAANWLKIVDGKQAK